MDICGECGQHGMVFDGDVPLCPECLTRAYWEAGSLPVDWVIIPLTRRIELELKERRFDMMNSTDERQKRLL